MEIMFKVILHQFWVKKICPWKFNKEYGGTFTKLFMHVSSRKMFPTTRNLQIQVHVYRPRHYCGDWLTFGCFFPMVTDHNLVKKSLGPMIADHDLVKKSFGPMIADHDLVKKRSNHGCWGKHVHIPDNDYWGIRMFPVVWTNFFVAIILMEYIYILFHQLNMSDNLPERVQILCHVHIICITVLEHRIICCQIFCDLLLKSAFEWIFYAMQLILVKIKWHMWKYLIQIFHDICLSYYFK